MKISVSYLPTCGEGIAIADACGAVVDVVTAFLAGRRQGRRQVLFQLGSAPLTDPSQSAHAPLDFGVQSRTALHGFSGNKSRKKKEYKRNVTHIKVVNSFNPPPLLKKMSRVSP